MRNKKQAEGGTIRGKDERRIFKVIWSYGKMRKTSMWERE